MNDEPKRELSPIEIPITNNLMDYITALSEKKYHITQLPIDVRVAVIGYLMCHGMMGTEISAQFDVPASTVYSWWQKFIAECADIVRETAKNMIGRLFAKSEHLYKIAMKKKEPDVDLAWKIETDLFDRLQKMGLIDQVAPRLDQVMKTADQLDAELEADLMIIRRIKHRVVDAPIAKPEENGNGNGRDNGHDA